MAAEHKERLDVAIKNIAERIVESFPTMTPEEHIKTLKIMFELLYPKGVTKIETE